MHIQGDGTVLPGWPKAINHVPASSSAVGDINGDGIPEIISESYIAVYAWKPNGDSLPGFPFMLPNGDANSYSSPVLADVNSDGKREIIFGTHVLGGGGYVYILKYDGTILPNWPKYVGNWIYGPPAVGKINNDNDLDIIVGDQVLSSNPSDYVYGWSWTGAQLPGFPIGPLNAINDQVSLVDINNDNFVELIFDDNTQVSSRGKYLAYKHDGSPVPGWSLETVGTTFFTTPCFGDLNGNNILEMVGAGVEGSGSSTYANIYLWNTLANYNPAKIYIPMWQYNTRHNGVYGDVTLTGVNKNKTVPDKYSLFQNYPNPFNPTTTIKYEIPKSANVSLKVFDILGREVVTLLNEYLSAGTYEAIWNANEYTSGVYFYKLQANNYSETKKLLLIK